MGWSKLILVFSAFNGMAAVCLGAFGAHALKSSLSEGALQTWHTAVSYHFYHVFALLVVGISLRAFDSKLLSASGLLFAVGIILFSGSLYLLALGGPRWLGPITPLGGMCFILAWLAMAISFLKG